MSEISNVTNTQSEIYIGHETTILRANIRNHSQEHVIGFGFENW